MIKKENKAALSQLVSTANIFYGQSFFDGVAKHGLESARIVAPLVQKLVVARKVVDIGCGPGAWLRAFQENGAEEIQGYDGDYVDRCNLLIERSVFAPIDLSKPFSINGKFDLAICLEVAEHLSARAGRELIERLTIAAPVVLFSAAIPNQGGTHHINEQWPVYWEATFQKRGYRKLDAIRRHIVHNSHVASYYRQNIVLYASEQAIAASALLREEAQITDGAEVEIVLQSILGRYQSVSGLLAELPKAICRAIKNRLV